MSHCLEGVTLRNDIHRVVAMVLLLQQYALAVMHDVFSTRKHVVTIVGVVFVHHL